MNEKHALGYNEIVCPYCRRAQEYEPNNYSIGTRLPVALVEPSSAVHYEVELSKYGIEVRCDKCEKLFLVDFEYENRCWISYSY